MTTVESMRETLATYTRQKSSVVDQLLGLNTQLASAKTNRDKRRVQNAIRNLEQQDKRLEGLIKSTNDDIARVELSENKFDAKTEAYKAGIDPNKAWADAISSGIGSVASTVGQFAGAGAFSKNVPKPTAGGNGKIPPTTPPPPVAEKDNTMLYIGIVIVAFFIFKK